MGCALIMNSAKYCLSFFEDYKFLVVAKWLLLKCWSPQKGEYIFLFKGFEGKMNMEGLTCPEILLYYTFNSILQEMISVADCDKDGRIDFEEFRKLMATI